MNKGVLSRYADYLPVTGSTPMITMGEGDTPLVRSQRVEKEMGVGELYFKLEGCNPTGSFKDRGMVVAVAKAVETGNEAIMCASTGNTSASASAYGARFGLTTYVLIPKGKIAQGKLVQALAHDARVVLVNGSFDQTLQLVLELTRRHPIALVNSINPFRLEGQKTAAFEIVDALGRVPDFLCIPVGNAGNITAYWKGFEEYHRREVSPNRPRMLGFQAEGAAPIVNGEPVQNPQTVASAIRIGNPASWKGAVAARDESGGLIDKVSDEEILDAYNILARREGIFGEPASAASLAGLMKLAREGMDFKGKTVVCVITGTGLKDPETAMSTSSPLAEVAPTISEVEAIIKVGAPRG
ncbi:MAG: threonine synthase [Dehalococcoidia bacterium]